MMGDIFISYHAGHHQEATALQSALEEAGFSCWNEPGMGTDEAMDPDVACAAIDQCPVFVLLLTDDAQNEELSKLCREVNMAMYQDKLIVPIGQAGLPVNDFFRFCLCFSPMYTGEQSWYLPPQTMIAHIRDYLTLVRAVQSNNSPTS